MTQKINTYFSILLITIAGAGAASLIVHVAYADTSEFAFAHSAVQAPLEQTAQRRVQNDSTR